MNDLVISSDRRFSRAILGLNKTEVYSYLNEIAGAYEELQLQIQVLKDQNNKLSDTNRENALKLYNMQNDITEAQKKTDRANVELEAAKKESAALRRELEAAEKRISKLMDELIKAGGSIDDAKSSDTPVSDSKVEEVKAEETKKYEPKDIFAGLKESVAKEKQAEEAKVKAEETKATVASEASTASSIEILDGDEVYAGEVEEKIDESMLIGNEDDEEEGFTFL